MAFRIDPRGDLPPPIISSRSYHARPDSTLSQHSHRKVATYGYPPATYPKKKPCYDWIFSTASNVHVAIDRSSFKEYVSFKSHILAVADQHHVPVKGVGTVELKVRRQPGGKESHKVVLQNVLHVPSWLCNIISDTCFTPAKDYDHTWTDFGISFEKKEDGRWQPWGYTENFRGLDKLVLSRKLEGRSPMLDDKEREIFSVSVTWPQSQRDKWDILIAEEVKREAEEYESRVRAELAKQEAKIKAQAAAQEAKEKAQAAAEEARIKAEAVAQETERKIQALPDETESEAKCKVGVLPPNNYKHFPPTPSAQARMSLSERDANARPAVALPSSRHIPLKTRSRSAFREALPWRYSTDR